MAPGWPEREFHEIAQTVNVVREDSVISSYGVHFDEEMPVEHGYIHAKEVLTKWAGGVNLRRGGGGRYETVDDWFEGVKAGENVPDQYHVSGLYGGHIMITIFGDPKAGLRRTCTLTLISGS